MVKFSLIIPAFNEEKYIEETLRSIGKQTFRDFEIIVKDGDSEDKTVEIAKKYADRVISAKDASIADARNQGARYARGSILVFVDADTELPPYALDRFADLIKDERIIGGSCKKIPKGGDLPDKLFYEFVSISTFLSYYLRIGGAHGNCMFIRKSIFKKIGGFNPRIKIGEEQDLVRKARKFGKFVFLLDMSVTEPPRRIRAWGRLKLYITWLSGTIRSFRVREKQVYEKLR